MYNPKWAPESKDCRFHSYFRYGSRNDCKTIGQATAKVLAIAEKWKGRTASTLSKGKVGEIVEVTTKNNFNEVEAYITISVLDANGKPSRATYRADLMFDVDQYIKNIEAHLVHMKSLTDPMKNYYNTP